MSDKPQLTGESVTDEQIRELLERGEISASLAVETGARLHAGQWHAPRCVRVAARARCAALINARTKETK